MRLRLILASCFAGALLLLFGQRVSSASAKQHKPSAASHKAQKPPAPVELRKATETDFPDPAPFVSTAKTRCDGNGGIYMVYAGGPPPSSAPRPFAVPNFLLVPLTRISPNSQTLTKFPIQSLSGYEQPYLRIGFSVDQWGDVYALVRARRSSAEGQGPSAYDKVVVKFNKDASVDSTYVLQNPPSAASGIGTTFAAFADGNLLATGIVFLPGSKQRLMPFQAVYDAHGDLLRELSLPGYAPLPTPTPTPIPMSKLLARMRRSRTAGQKGRTQAKQTTKAKTPAAVGSLTLVVSGPKNTVYLLHETARPTLFTISSDGRVLHEVHFQIPVRGGRPVDMSRAGPSDVAIAYYTSGSDKAGGYYTKEDFAIVDSATGKIAAIYTVLKGPPGFFACATSPTDFLFVGSTKSRHLAVFKYSGS